MAIKLMGKKRGMIQLFDDKGQAVPCTVIEVEPNIVTQIKTLDKDGYKAIQLGFEKIIVKDPRTMTKRAKKPQLGQFEKIGIQPRKYLSESRIDNVNEFTIGQEIGVNFFLNTKYIDATGTSKGKGYQGVIKLYNYSGGPAAHGSSFHRHHGSTGMRSTPGRLLPGGKAACHMGDRRVTVQNLKIIMINEEDNLIVVQGQVPGAKNGLVYITQAKKKHVA